MGPGEKWQHSHTRGFKKLKTKVIFKQGNYILVDFLSFSLESHVSFGNHTDASDIQVL